MAMETFAHPAALDLAAISRQEEEHWNYLKSDTQLPAELVRIAMAGSIDPESRQTEYLRGLQSTTRSS